MTILNPSIPWLWTPPKWLTEPLATVANGSIARTANGARIRTANGAIQDCCCGCPNPPGTNRPNQTLCGDLLAPNEYHLTLSGVTFCQSCLDSAFFDDTGCVGSVGSLLDTDLPSLDATYLLKKDSVPNNHWENFLLDTFTGKTYADDGCSGASSGGTRFIFARAVRTNEITWRIEAEYCACDASESVTIFRAFVTELCCTKEVTVSNGIVVGNCGSVGIPDAESRCGVADSYVVAHGGTATLTPFA